MRRLLIAACLLAPLVAGALDLRDYLPSSNTVRLSSAAGEAVARYTFTAQPPGYFGLYQGLMNLGKPGRHYTWRKDYWKNGAWCTPTVAILFLGDDQSVTEVGDWMAATPCVPGRAFGYRTDAGAVTGLAWAPPGGLTEKPAVVEMKTWAQDFPGAAYRPNGYGAYSKVGLIEVLPSYTPPIGRDVYGQWGEGRARTYTNVVHMVMYHGTRAPNPAPVRCDMPPIAARGAYYQSFRDYDTYAIELWLAAGIGVIQERITFMESGAFWGLPNCNGAEFSGPGSWATYIDEN